VIQVGNLFPYLPNLPIAFLYFFVTYPDLQFRFTHASFGRRHIGLTDIRKAIDAVKATLLFIHGCLARRLLNQREETFAGIIQRGRLFRSLLQKAVYGIDLFDCAVDSRIGTSFISANIDQILRVPVNRQKIANAVCRLRHGLVDELGHQSADAAQNIDTGILTTAGKLSIENDMPIQYRSNRIRDRVAHVITLHQDGIERRDAAFRNFPERSSRRAKARIPTVCIPSRTEAHQRPIPLPAEPSQSG